MTSRHEMSAAEYRIPKTEAALQRHIRSWAKDHGWKVTHHPYSIGADPGYPDLTCIHPSHDTTIWIECKGPKGRLREKQIEYLATVNTQPSRLGIVAYPKDFEAVEELLAGRPVEIYDDPKDPVLRVRMPQEQ